MATTPSSWSGKKPDVLFRSITADPENMVPFALGARAGGWLVQWYRSVLVACPQCWLPGTGSDGLSGLISLVESGRAGSWLLTLVVVMVDAPFVVKEQPIRVIHEPFLRREMHLRP